MASLERSWSAGLVALVAVAAAVMLALPSWAGAAQLETSRKKGQATAKTTSKVRHSQRVVIRNGKRVMVHHASLVRYTPARPSFGQLYGLRETADSLDLRSSVALVVDLDTNEVLLSKNAQAVLPIASLTKLMTGVVIAEGGQPLDEVLEITSEDVDTEKGSRSRLRVGARLTREEMLHLALMASENRAAHALGRNYPGGTEAFVVAMNLKARELGMNDTQYVEPTGLSSRNQSSARDLAILAKSAHEHQIIRELSTSAEYQVDVGRRPLRFHTTNRLVNNPGWDISLQKTGYISEAGQCLLMQAKVVGRQLIMVFLDSAGKYSRLGDAERVRRWLNESAAAVPASPGGPRLTS